MVLHSHTCHHKKKKSHKFINNAIYAVGILGPVFTIPQVIKIWINQSAVGVSVISWLAYFILSMFWVYYGFVHKDKPIIISYSFWIFFSALIVIGVFIYG